MIVHSIGDSHSGGISPLVVQHHLGPVLCYSFGNESLIRCDIRDFNIQNGDVIIFCFGEIDCRCHVHKHITETRSYQQIIDNIIEKYFEAININIIFSNLELKHICVYNIVPPAKTEFIPGNPEFPFLGSDEERKEYTLYFNKKLKEKCIENDFIFFDVYDKYIDQNGFLSKELSVDGIHITDNTHTIKFIEENIFT